MADYRLFLDEAPNIEEEVDLDNQSTWLPFIKRCYVFWNKKLFGDKLPGLNEFTLDLTDRKTAVGYFYKHWKDGVTTEELQQAEGRGRLYECTDCGICLNLAPFGLNERSFHETIIHEMCHAAVWLIDGVYEVGNRAADGYQYIQQQFWGRGLSTEVTPGHHKHWREWMKRCGLDPIAGQMAHRYEFDPAFEHTKMMQKRKAKTARFVPWLKEEVPLHDAMAIPVRFFVDPYAGIGKIGKNERKLECFGVLCIFQLWANKRASIVDRRRTMLYLAYQLVKDDEPSEEGRVQSGELDIENVPYLDMMFEPLPNNIRYGERMITLKGNEWLPKLQRLLSVKFFPRKRLTMDELEDLLTLNYIDSQA